MDTNAKKRSIVAYHVKMILYALLEHCTRTTHDLRYVQPISTGNYMYVNVIFVCAKNILLVI